VRPDSLGPSAARDKFELSRRRRRAASSTARLPDAGDLRPVLADAPGGARGEVLALAALAVVGHLELAPRAFPWAGDGELDDGALDGDVTMARASDGAPAERIRDERHALPKALPAVAGHAGEGHLVRAVGLVAPRDFSGGRGAAHEEQANGRGDEDEHAPVDATRMDKFTRLPLTFTEVGLAIAGSALRQASKLDAKRAILRLRERDFLARESQAQS